MDFKQAISAYAKMMGVSESEAKQDAEQTIKIWMRDEHMTREFAEASWIEDQEDANPQVVEEMTKKAKASGASKIQAKADKKPANYSLEGAKKRERKPNEEKRALIEWIFNSISEFSDTKEVEKANIEREVTFKLGGTSYSVVLTAHRKPKKG